MIDWKVTIIIAVVASIPGLWAVWRQLRKDRMDQPKARADAADILVDTSMVTIAQLRERIQELEKKVQVMQGQLDGFTITNREVTAEFKVWRSRAELLRYQLVRNGLEPCIEWENGKVEEKGDEIK